MITELFSSMTASDDAARSFNSFLIPYQFYQVNANTRCISLKPTRHKWLSRASARQCQAGPEKGTQPDLPGRDRPGSTRIRASGPRHKDKKGTTTSGYGSCPTLHLHHPELDGTREATSSAAGKGWPSSLRPSSERGLGAGGCPTC